MSPLTGCPSHLQNSVLILVAMKTKLRLASQLSALALSSAAVAQFVGLVSFPGVTTTALVGGLVAASVLAFALGDYARKPSFRVRRTFTDPAETTPGLQARAGATSPDWTYTTRAK